MLRPYNSPEVVVKAVDGCSVSNHRCVFAAGLTNLNVVLREDETGGCGQEEIMKIASFARRRALLGFTLLAFSCQVALGINVTVDAVYACSSNGSGYNVVAGNNPLVFPGFQLFPIVSRPPNSYSWKENLTVKTHVFRNASDAFPYLCSCNTDAGAVPQLGLPGQEGAIANVDFDLDEVLPSVALSTLYRCGGDPRMYWSTPDSFFIRWPTDDIPTPLVTLAKTVYASPDSDTVNQVKVTIHIFADEASPDPLPAVPIDPILVAMNAETLSHELVHLKISRLAAAQAIQLTNMPPMDSAPPRGSAQALEDGIKASFKSQFNRIKDAESNAHWIFDAAEKQYISDHLQPTVVGRFSCTASPDYGDMMVRNEIYATMVNLARGKAAEGLIAALGSLEPPDISNAVWDSEPLPPPAR